jgi:peptidoglycan/xylan/chitin deacetylase (PgdA/CDA1 family)
VQGIFTISLDFELHWGVFDKKDRSTRTSCYKNTLALIPELLKLFEKYEVNATWATVGGVFAKDRFEWEQLKPAIQPEYFSEKYSAYKWVNVNGLPENLYFAHFAPETIDYILKYPGQELGTHTFGHYYCLEKQNGFRAFDADLKAAKKTALKFNNTPISLVFPRNQFNDECLEICFNNDIKVVRSNPGIWFWTPIAETNSKFLRKLFRTGDAYIQLARRTSYPLQAIQVKRNQPIQLPASRFLRPWQSKYRLANTLSLQRVLKEIKTAAIHKECYHLWWHPENFGNHPSENLKNLNLILQEYKNCKMKYGMTSWNMGEYAKHLL